MKSLVFTIPGSPVPGARARVFERKNGRGEPTGAFGAAVPAKSKAYQKHVATCAWAAALSQRWNRPVKGQPLGIVLIIYRKVGARGDASNYLKVVEDGINDSHMVWHDDRYVEEIVVKMVTSDLEKPRIDVKVTWNDLAQVEEGP